MRNTLVKILSTGLIAIGLAACGSSSTVPLAVNGVGASAGSSLVASGLIGFSGTTNGFNQTTVLAGLVPQGPYAGNYGQVAAGASSVVATATTGSIQYTQQRPAGANGQFILQASLASNTQLVFTGTVQLSSQLMQEILATYGQSATVTSIGIWAVQNLVSSGYSSYGYAAPTYSGPLEQVEIWLYVNGSSQPIGPIVF
jgi:hypothetical protein